MKKRFLMIMLVIILLGIVMSPTMKIQAEEITVEQADGTSSFIPTSYSNQLKNYVPDLYGNCRTSFLGKLSEGGYQTVVFCGEKLYIQCFDSEYQAKLSKVIDLELPLWGGIYLGETYNYVVCGKGYDSEADKGGEVFRVIKYDKNFERMESISLSSDETYTAIPFANGNVSMDEDGNLLTIYTCRLRLDGHQSNIAIHINTDDMTVADSKGMINFPDVHVSHSFRQIFKYDNGSPVYVDVSDAYPKRSFYIQSEKISASLMDIDGKVGDNITNAELSGLAISDTHYLVAGTYLHQGMNNIFLSSMDKNSGEVQTQWLTMSAFYAPEYVHNPRITQIGENRFVVMWGSNALGGHVTDYILVDGKGNVVSELKENNVSITDCEPIYDNGKILWLSAENGNLKFNEITDLSENGKYEPEVRRVLSVNAWDGTADTGWYDTRKTEFNLSSAQQLAGLAQLVNDGDTFEGKKINLSNDIFLNEESYLYDWVPIARYNSSENTNSDKAFQGTFNGNGKTIYNLKTGTSDDGGMFGCIGEKGVVKCLNISQGFLNSGGCIANVNYGMISFCNNYSYVGGIPCVGGICNCNYNLVYGCKNFGYVWGWSSAGIVGCNKVVLATVSQCSNHGFVEGTDMVSGIVDSNYGWMYNCYNRGVILDGNKMNGANALCGIVYNNAGECDVENCYSVGIFSYGRNYVEIYPVCSDDYYKNVKNCYTIFSDIAQKKDMADVISYEELMSPDFITRIDQQTHSVLPVWMRDAQGINDGLPITVADYSCEIGQCKIQPELWISKPSIEADLKDKEYTLKFECYYNEAKPIVTVENTDMAEISDREGNYVILLKKKGTTQINIHLDETENNSSVDYQLPLEISSSEKKSLADCQIVLASKSVEYNGKAQKPSVTIKDDSYILENDKDYTVKYKNNVNVGTAKIIITGKGDYTGDVTQTFEIKKAKQKLTYKSSYKKTFGDNDFTLKVKAENGTKKMTYTSSNKKVVTVNGKGKVTIKGTGYAIITVKIPKTNSYATQSIKIKISVAPQKQVIQSVKAVKGGKLSISWKKDKRATGYQIQCSTDKKFKKNVKKVWINKNGTTSKTIAKLKKGKKNYVRVRSYKTVKVDGKTTKIYSDWSKVKKITIKK